jgi:hypothetical protein
MGAEIITPQPASLRAVQVSIPIGCVGIMPLTFALDTPASAFASLVFDINYDSTVLDLNGTSVNDAMMQRGLEAHSQVVAANTATITVMSPSQDMPIGEVARLHFEPLTGTAGDVVPIAFSNVYGYTKTGVRVSLDFTVGSVLLAAEDPDCDPTATPGRPLDTGTMVDPPMPEGLTGQTADEAETPCDGCNCDDQAAEGEAAAGLAVPSGRPGGGGMLPALVMATFGMILLSVRNRSLPTARKVS